MIDAVETLRKLTLAAARASGATRLAKPMLGGLGAILMLHRVSAAPGKPLGCNRHLCVQPRFLDSLLGKMRSEGYRFVSMDDAVGLIRRPDRGAPFAAVTLDDGYRDNLTEALPVFEKHSVPFTIYIAPGLIDGEVDLWWEILEDVVTTGDRIDLGQGGLGLSLASEKDRISAFRTLLRYLTQDVAEAEQPALVRQLADEPKAREAVARTRSLLMNWDEISEIARHPLATIGAHTVNHVALRRLGEIEARREMQVAADRLEECLGRRPRHMAYPYGYAVAVGEREASLAASLGFASAVTTRHGLVQREHAAHLHALPRLSLNGRYQTLGEVETMLSGLTAILANRGKRVVTM